MRHLPALTFLSAPEIPQAFDDLKNIVHATVAEIIEWFEENYVHGRIRNRVGNGQIRKSLPLFPPEIWSAFENVEFGFPCTQNDLEAWHRRWNAIKGKAHISLYKIIYEIKEEQNSTGIEIERIVRREPIPKRRKDVNRENGSRVIIADRANRTNITFLRGIAHNLVL